MKIFRFPFDTQKCRLEFVFDDYVSSEVAWIQLNTKAQKLYKNSSEWEMMSQNRTIDQVTVYTVNNDSFEEQKKSRFTYYVELRRNPSQPIAYVVIPTVLISSFNIIAYILPSNSGNVTIKTNISHSNE